jgi:hypothetical protein
VASIGHPNTVRLESHCALGLRCVDLHCDRPRALNELKTAITAFIRKNSQADLQKVFVNKSKWVQALIVARGHHLQHLL